MPKYDVVIIGSGLGGLQCGFILSKEGYNVCIVEKNKQIGGCLQNFIRDGVVFDTGVHYVGSLDEGQILNQYFKYFDLIGRLEMKKQDVDGFDRINFQGKEYKYAMGYDNFIDTLVKDFPKEKKNLIEYCNKIKGVCSDFPLYNLEESDLHFSEFKHFEVSAYNVIKSYTSDTKLQNILANINLLYAGDQEKTPLHIHALIKDSFIKSSWRFVNGSAQIAKFLAESIIKHNGTILKDCAAEKLVVEDGQIKYMEVSRGERIEAKHFISNIHPVNTLELIDPDKIRKSFRNRINSLDNTMSYFSLYISLKPGSFKYINYNYYFHRGKNVWVQTEYSNSIWPCCYLLITNTTSMSEDYAKGITVIAPMEYQEMEKWTHTTVGNRGQEYLEFKRRKAEILIDLIEKSFPSFRASIKNYWSSTPLTIRDYTGTKDGGAYGVQKDFNEPLKTLILPRTKIPNLLFTGQNIILHGVLGVTIGAIYTCAILLGLNYLIKKIKAA